MRHLYLVVGLLVCACGQPSEAESFDMGLARIAAKFAGSLEGHTIAVLEFPDLESRTTNLSRLVSEQLTTELVQQTQGRAILVERRQVIQLLTELNLLNTDLTSMQVARVGRQLGADAIVLGSATLLGTQVVVNVRLVDVSAGRVLAADRMNISGSEPLVAMAAQGMSAPGLTGVPQPKGQTDASTSAPSSAAPPTREGAVGDIEVHLIGCTAPGTTVVCELRFRNNGPDRNLSLSASARTRIIDQDGTAYRASAVDLAGDRRTYSVEKSFVTGVPIGGRITFSPVGEKVRLIPLLEVRASAYGDWYTLQFRDVSISR